jgi:hypothetical protein
MREISDDQGELSLPLGGIEEVADTVCVSLCCGWGRSKVCRLGDRAAGEVLDL